MDLGTLSQEIKSTILGRGLCKDSAIFHRVLRTILLLHQEMYIFTLRKPVSALYATHLPTKES